MSTKVLGVDLGTSSIKIAELDVSGRGFALANFFEFPLSIDPAKDKAFEIIEALRDIAGRYEPGSTRWVIGVPQHSVSVHHRRFPFRERSKILKSLPFELEDDIPLDIDETIFEAKVVEFLGPSAEVLTVACPKESVAEALRIGKDGGFDPEIVSVEGLGLANIFEAWSQPPPDVPPDSRQIDETTAFSGVPHAKSRVVLHMGHTRSLLLVYRDTGLVAVRAIQWGGLEIAESLSRSFKVPLVESIKVLRSRAFILTNSNGATKDQVKLSQAVAYAVDNLIRELRLSLLEVKAAFGIDFQMIEMLGGASQVQNLGAYMTQGLEIPVNMLTGSLGHIESRFPLTPQIEAVAPVAVGLAIEGLKRPRNPAVNLRREEFARENLVLKKLWQEWRIPAQVAAAAFAIFTFYSFTRDYVAAGLLESADTRVSEVATSAAKLKGASATETGLRKFIKSKKDLIKNRQALSEIDSYVPAMDYVAKLSERIGPGKPPGLVDVSYLKIDNEDLTIEGTAKNADYVNTIEKALQGIAKPKTVVKTSPTQGTPAGGTPFAFKAKLNRKP